MNLILFTEEELSSPLPLADERSEHILHVLGRSIGEPFDVGIIDGPRGKAVITKQDSASLSLHFELSGDTPGLFPVTLMVGLSRPMAMRRVLRDLTSLGVGRLWFFSSERGEQGYRQSTLWTRGEFRRHLIDGAQQAFTTKLPEVRLFPSLVSCIDAHEGDSLGATGPRFLAALDNYEADLSLPMALAAHSEDLARSIGAGGSAAIAVGSERGWSSEERQCLREKGFALAHLGKRVLRTEVACVSAVSIVLSGAGLFDEEPTSRRRSSRTSS